jgi:Cys-tRNA(Pro)/Cys-tRNA(Cys) deacylase
MSTPGIQFLKRSKIAFEVVHYEHLEKGAEFAAQAVGFSLSQTIKTLVVSLSKNQHVLVLAPGDRQVSMKKIAAASGTKKATMADTETAQRLTGYHVGGISPFGIKKKLTVLMEASLKHFSEVMINAGRRGTMVKMSPEDIIKVLRPRVGDLVH